MNGRLASEVAILITAMVVTLLPLNVYAASESGNAQTVNNEVGQFINAHAFPPQYLRSPSSPTMTLSQLAQKWAADVNTPITQFPQPVTVNTTADLTDQRPPDSRDSAFSVGQISPEEARP